LQTLSTDSFAKQNTTKSLSALPSLRCARRAQRRYRNPVAGGRVDIGRRSWRGGRGCKRLVGEFRPAQGNRGSRLVDLRLEVFPREEQTPEALGALVRAGVDKWWPIIREFGIKAE
jgi:hypothetical protein